jgi:TolB-like protein
MGNAVSTIELRVTQRQLLVDGAVVALGARAFDVLLALANRRGSVVTKAELFAAAWAGMIVDDNNLQAQVSALRKVLGPDAIATVPQRGYQLVIAPNVRLTVQSADARAPQTQPTEPLLAVLPFDNLSNDAEMQFFCEGVSDELLQRLSRGANLKVIGRTSSFQFRGDRKSGAANALKCTHVLDGSIRRAEGRVRLSVHLVETATQTTLWSDRFDRDLEDIFQVQDEIAENIASALNRTLSAATTEAIDPAVYDLYLHGIRPALTPIEMQSRIDLLEAVTQRAPNFVCGWGKLAEQRAHLRLHRPYPDRDALAKVVASEAAKAQKIDDRNPGARIAQYLLLPPWGRFIEAETIVERMARDANGTGWLVHTALHLRSVGRVREALEIARRSFELDALNPFVANAMGLGLWYAGLTAEARASFEATLSRWPDMPAPANNLIMLCADAGDWDAVDALLSPARLAKHPLRQFEQGARGYVAIKRAATPAALHSALASARQQFENTGFTFHLLAILAHLGARDETYAMADAATFTPVGDRDDVMGLDAYRTYFLFHASYPELRADRRFIRLCARLGLVQYWTATQKWPDCVDEVPYDFKKECMSFAANRLTPAANAKRRSA